MADDQKLNLLIVEDDSVDREAIHRLLRGEFELQDAETAAAAFDYLSTAVPDGVLLDYRLPDADGLEILPKLVKNDIPVIVLTGEESTEVIVEAMQLGAQDYLVKGHLSRESLIHAIANAIEKTALKRDLQEKQRRLEEQAQTLELKNKEVRALASALTLAEQRERRRIAQVLHDDVQQMLYGILAQSHLIKIKSPPDVQVSLDSHFDDMNALIHQTIDAARTLAVELSPPVLKLEGMSAAFEWLSDQMYKMHGLSIELVMPNECYIPSEDLRVLVIQLVRELLFNVVKHAGVNEAKLMVSEQRDFLGIDVADNGEGFKLNGERLNGAYGGFGLYSVQERLDLLGGSLRVESAPGQGTVVSILVPLDPNTVKVNKLGASGRLQMHEEKHAAD